MDNERLGWLPPDGIHFTAEEVAAMLEAVRAILNGTDELEPNQAGYTIAFMMISALRREEGTD